MWFRARESNSLIRFAPTSADHPVNSARASGRLEVAIDTVVQRSAGLDIAKASLVACVRIPDADGGWRVIKRKFTAMTAELLALQDWLAEH